MARPLRIEYPGALYHITSRGNAKNPIFVDKKDKESFLDILHTVVKKYNLICHAYCLMDNHYHLLIETPEANLSKGIRQLNGVYTQRFNRRHKRTGHVFEGRYKAILVDRDSYLLEVARYIVLNPVRARIVDDPRQYRFSSYPATSGQAKPHLALSTDFILAQFAKTRAAAAKRYRAFVKDGIGETSILKKTKGQVLLGDEDFVKRFTYYLAGEIDSKEIPKSQRLAGRPSLESLFNPGMVLDKAKRDDAIHKAVEEHGYAQKEIADHLKLHYSTVSRIMTENGKRAKVKT